MNCKAYEISAATRYGVLMIWVIVILNRSYCITLTSKYLQKQIIFRTSINGNQH